jgi:hypothetical protein
MKNKIFGVIAVLSLLFSIAAYSQSAVAFHQAQGVPAGVNSLSPVVVSYQGYVRVNGNPFNGIGHFKFAVVDAVGTTSYWSNNGSSTGGGEPTGTVTLTVTNGLFSVLLGESPMESLTADVFSAPDRLLRVWFSSDGGTNYSQLTPDRTIASVPYAYVADVAGDADLLDGLDSLDFALAGHDHDGVYAEIAHNHDALYAALSHTHEALYAAIGHNHDAAYVNDNAGEVGDADILAGALSPDRILGTAWTGSNDGSSTGLDADLLDGQQSNYYQRQVSGTCPNGYAVLAILSDGTVACEPVEARPVFARTTLDSDGFVGSFTSITIGEDGLGLISYFDATNGDLKVAHCSDAACTSTTVTRLDSGGVVGEFNSITIGTDGLGLISYYDATNGDLKVAHCSDAACTSATITTLDSGGVVGEYTSIIIGADGLGLISYRDGTNGDLKVAHCSNTVCNTATYSTLDSGGDVGYFTSITIGADGLGLISYYDITNGDLKVAHCSDIACTAATITTLDSGGNAGYYISITIGVDGLGLISYMNFSDGDLKVAHCSDTACTSAMITTLDSSGNVGLYTSITIGAEGLGLISYFDGTKYDLKVAHCSNIACSEATYTVVDSAEEVGAYNSITIGADGLGLISYYDQTNDDLKVVHLSNTLGTPWVRRR